MLLGTRPIPARSPAEREGQNGKEMRRERGGQKRRGGTVGSGEWVISRWNDWGEETA